MKKVLVAIGICVLVAGLAYADATRLYRLSGSTVSYYGAPRSGLPSTGYLTIEEGGAAWVVWFWTEAGRRYVNEPIQVNTWNLGVAFELLNVGDWFARDYYVEDELVASGFAEWRLTGTWLNTGLPPWSLSGNGSSEYWNALIGVGMTTGRGYHSARAMGYRLLTGEADTAEGAAIQIFDQLLATGYAEFDDGSGSGIHIWD
ncbi:MAG: hypothetical protein BWY59_00788 [Verrucomicrobia bacterium ADurb.Bin345]|nr:MAG: hypothetical protein BWY59_00788 [Verrucomicrobia bacterium ADurb.Bin345]